MESAIKNKLTEATPGFQPFFNELQIVPYKDVSKLQVETHIL
jgi:hypothetical protein